MDDTSAGKVALAWAILEKEKCSRVPEYWLSKYVKTADEHAKDGENPIKPFPMRPYMTPIVREWHDATILHIVKSRQMSMSWLASAMLLWESQFYAHRTAVIINKSSSESEQGIDRAKLIYNNQPLWLKNLCPLDRKPKEMPRDALTFKNGSKILALPQGADKVRGMVPYTALMDEAAFQDELEPTYAACVPCCHRIVTVSSAGPGFFERLCRG